MVVTVVVTLPGGRTATRTVRIDADDADGPVLDRRVALAVREAIADAEAE